MKRRLLLFIICSGIVFAACDINKKQTMMAQENTALFPKGNKQPDTYFTGNVFLHVLLTKDKNNEFALGSVPFEPGARTVWHTHPKGQVLIVTEGGGRYQERGKPAQVIKKGGAVKIPENVEHWHGASANSQMVHIAITNYEGDENVVWLQPVSDEDYEKANEQ